MKKNSLLIISLLFILLGCASKEIKKDEKCFQKGETGKCRAFFIKYHFNQESNSCEKFVWGGCGGNVPFDSLEQCQKTCEE